jgi:hypothetical protein
MKRASAIHFLSTCRFWHRLAAAFWEKTVQIWDLDLREQVGQFDTAEAMAAIGFVWTRKESGASSLLGKGEQKAGLLAMKFRLGN